MSIASDENTGGISVQTRPKTPTSKPSRGALTDNTQILVSYGPLDSSLNGGSVITSYVLYWNQSGSMQPVHGFATDSLDQTFTVTSLVSSGQSYQFEWRAKNVHGLSDPSPIETILAAGIP